MTTAFARVLVLAAIPLVALLEMAVQWRIPRGAPAEGDWLAAAAWIEGLRNERDLVLIAPDWAVQGRVHLGGLLSPRDLGRFDTTRHERLFEVSWRGARAPETAGLVPEEERRFGALTVRRYDPPPPPEIRYDLLDDLDRCTAGGGRCPRARFLVDHQWGTRLVIPVRLSRDPVSLSFEGAPGGGVLRGHAFIGRLDYRAHRLPSGEPARLEFSFDGEPVTTVTVENLSGPARFEVELPGDRAGVLGVEISAADGFDRTLGLAGDVRERAPQGD